MQHYLYLFGYEGPDERLINQKHGTDWEKTGFFRILADSEEEALRWGEELAERYVSSLYPAGTEAPSWRGDNYASWIEPSPDEIVTAAASGLPELSVGELPSFEQVRAVFED